MTGPSSRVPVLLVLVWLGGLLVATSVGLLAVRLVAAQVGDPAVTPLSAAAAASAAASPTTTPGSAPAQPTGTPPPTGTTTPSAPAQTTTRSAPPTTTTRPAPLPPASTRPAPVPPPRRAGPARTFAIPAGTLGVQCVGTELRLLYATPAQGYALDERSVAGTRAEVRFEGGGTRVRVRLSCATGAPQLVEQRTDPDGGGDDGADDDDRRQDRDDDDD